RACQKITTFLVSGQWTNKATDLQRASRIQCASLCALETAPGLIDPLVLTQPTSVAARLSQRQTFLTILCIQVVFLEQIGNRVMNSIHRQPGRRVSAVLAIAAVLCGNLAVVGRTQSAQS